MLAAVFYFLIIVIELFGAGYILALTLDKLSPDPFMAKIGKIAVGVTFVVIGLLAVLAVFQGGGTGFRPSVDGMIWFAVGIICIVIVLFILDYLLKMATALLGADLINLVKYVIFGLAICAILIVTDQTLLGGAYTTHVVGPLFGETPRISR